VIPSRYFPSSCALVSNRVCQLPSYRWRLSGGNRLFVSTLLRRELGGTAFAPIVVRASLRLRLPAAVIPLTVIRRQLIVHEHVAAGVGGEPPLFRLQPYTRLPPLASSHSVRDLILHVLATLPHVLHI
jgi:hypothetical protein